MKKLLIAFSFLVFHFSWCSAQDTLAYKSNRKTEDPNYQPICINAGIGASIIKLAVIALHIDDFVGQGAGTFLNQSPAYNCTIDYTFSNRFCIGIAGAYQWITDNPYAPPINNVSETWAVEKMTRYNIAGRLLYQCLKVSTVDLYLGVRAGVSIWTDKMISNDPPNQYVNVVNPTFIGTEQNASFQVLVGTRIFFSYNLGVHFEFGIGTPYIIEAGITFRFKTRKDKAR